LYGTAIIELHDAVALLVVMYIVHAFAGPIVFFFSHLTLQKLMSFTLDPQSSSKQSSMDLAPAVVVRPAGHFVQFVEFSSAA
jgi:hypothetical protein